MTTLQTLIRDCAYAYRDDPPWSIPSPMKRDFKSQVADWYKRIPLPIRWLEAYEQPFDTNEQMAGHCTTHGELLMLVLHSDEIGADLYNHHRAVHDWFGHVDCKAAFGAEGECKSFLEHCKHYTPAVLPIVFSDVVLINCYEEVFNTKITEEKWVYRPDLQARLKAFNGKI